MSLSSLDSQTDPLVSTTCDLKIILSESPIPNDLGVYLANPLSKKKARQLAHALAILSTKIDVSKVWLTVICVSTGRSSNIVAEGLRSLRGLGNISLVLYPKPGPASILSKTTVRSLQEIPRVNSTCSLASLSNEISYQIINHVLNDDHPQRLCVGDKIHTLCCKRCMPSLFLADGHCACQNLAGGYSTTCRCNHKRTALFWTNQTLFEQSSYALLSTNSIILSRPTIALRFLSSLSDANLRAITKLHIELHYHEYFLFPGQVLEKFIEIVNIIKDKCNLVKLRLTIDFSVRLSMKHDFLLTPWRLNEEEERNIIDALRPLKLRGLDQLYIYLIGATPEVEKRMETSVMGEHYDAIARGKLHTSLRDPYFPEQPIEECRYASPVWEEMEPKTAAVYGAEVLLKGSID